MPMLTTTTLPLSVGAPASPQGDPVAQTTASAPEAGGESREGNPTSAKQNTWTRLFQSLLTDQNQTQGTTSPAQGSGTPAQGSSMPGQGSATSAPRGPARSKDSGKKDSAGADTSAATAAAAALQSLPWIGPILQAPVQAVPISPAYSDPATGSAAPSAPASEASVVTASVGAGSGIVSSGANPSADTLTAGTGTAASMPAQVSSFGRWVESQSQPPGTETSQSFSARGTSKQPPGPSSAPELSPASQSAENGVSAEQWKVTTGALAALAQPKATSQSGGATPGAMLGASLSGATDQPSATDAATSRTYGFAQVAGSAPAASRVASAAAAGQQAGAGSQASTPSAAQLAASAQAAQPLQFAQDDSVPESAADAGDDPVSAQSATPTAGNQRASQVAATSNSAATTFIKAVSAVNPSGASQSSPHAGKNPAAEGSQQTDHASAPNEEKTKTGTQTGQTGSNTATSSNTAPAGSSAQPAVASTVNMAANPVQGASQADRIEVIRQVANQVSAVNPAQAGGSTVTVQLHPAEWGDVKVSLTMLPAQAASGTDAKSAVAATLVASDPSVGNILQSHLPDLSRALNSAGFSVDKVEVVVQATTAATAGQGGSAFHQGQNPNNGGGFLPNPSGLSAHTGGGANQQGAPFGSAMGQQQGQRENSHYTTTSIAGQPEPDTAVPVTAQFPVQKGRVDYRI